MIITDGKHSGVVIGFSLTRCIEDICLERISADDVWAIMTGPNFGGDLSKMKSYGIIHWKGYQEKAFEVLEKLFAEGRILEPKREQGFKEFYREHAKREYVDHKPGPWPWIDAASGTVFGFNTDGRMVKPDPDQGIKELVDPVVLWMREYMLSSRGTGLQV